LKICLNDGCHPSEILGIRRVDPTNIKKNEILPSLSLFDIIHKLFHQYMKTVEFDYPEIQIRYQCDISFSGVDLNAIFRCLSDENERILLIEKGIQCSLENSSNYKEEV
jgi:hypothetical protein